MLLTPSLFHATIPFLLIGFGCLGYGTISFWAELSRLLQDEREMFDGQGQGQRRKLVIFTEHRDRLTYLAERIRGLLGRAQAVVTIFGGMSRSAKEGAMN